MKKAILFGVPHHSNLGDHAIAIAEKEIIKRKFPEYEYKEVAEENINKCMDKIQSYIEDEDLIFFHGGGNLGNKYIFTENGRRKVIKKFPKNKIILFPETMYFENNDGGKRELEISKEIYNSHPNLYIMAREEVSYNSIKKEFKNAHVFLTPDIVTILQESEPNTLREGALFILRSDTESKADKHFLNKIENICKKNYSKIQYTDTAKGGCIYENQKKQKLDEMLDLYRHSQLVVTDRLHGMIFAVITGTPCIAVGNYNHKIESSSKWFENLPYIKYITERESMTDIEKQIKTFKQLENYSYDNKYSIDIFNEVFEKVGEK